MTGLCDAVEKELTALYTFIDSVLRHQFPPQLRTVLTFENLPDIFRALRYLLCKVPASMDGRCGGLRVAYAFCTFPCVVVLYIFCHFECVLSAIWRIAANW